jgi:hypothetical protein
MNAFELSQYIAARLEEDGLEYAIGGALALTAWAISTLLADMSPCAMKRAVEPEPHLVAEHHDAAAGSGRFDR